MSDLIRIDGGLAAIGKVRALDRLVAKLPWIGRYTAGPSVQDAVRKMRSLSGEGIGGIANILGEHDIDKKVIGRTFMQYGMLVEGIAGEKLVRPAISLKPTQFGLCQDGSGAGSETAAQLMRELSAFASGSGIFVWLDMEGSYATDFTLNLYRDLSRRGIRSGVALQANLIRTFFDLAALAAFSRAQDTEVCIRLVRGIYREDAGIAFSSREEAHASFARLMRSAFFDCGDKFRVSVGTHHPGQVIRALALSGEFPGRLLDMQFLLGAVDAIPRSLAESGIPCTYYVPCGPRFFEYGIRRMKENPGGLWGLLTSRLRERRNLRGIRSFMSGETKVDLSDPELPVSH